MSNIALTTTDNPWNPFTHWTEWMVYDNLEKGYCTQQYAARLAPTSPIFSDELNDQIIRDTFVDILEFDLIGKLTGGKVHYKVVVEDENRGEGPE